MSDLMVVWSPGVTLDAIERQVIDKAYIYYKGNKTQTANALGISIKTLDNKFERYRADDALAEKAKQDAELNRERFLYRSRFGSLDANSFGRVNAEPPPPPARVGASAHPEARNELEPVVIPPPQSALSVPVGSEIQEMLPSKAPTRRKRTSG